MARSVTVDPEEFVKAWQTAVSVNEVADRLGISKLGASVKASHLRKEGVPLKKFRTGIGSDPDEFIRIWNDATSLEDAAEQLGVQKTSASMRASHLRKMGHPVKRFRRGRKLRDILALSELARSITA
jgi:biotin operon repressor